MDVEEEIKSIIGKILKIEPDALRPEAKLSELAVDSLDLVEMVYSFEERFDITMELEAKDSSFVVKMTRRGQVQSVKFVTVGDVIEAVHQIVDAKVG